MASQTPELVSTSLGEIRAAAAAWERLEPQERRRRIRDYLMRQAESHSIDPAEFAAAVVAVLPAESAAAETGAVAACSEPAEKDDHPADPVDRVIALTQALTPVDRRRLLERMRELDLIPPVPPAVAAARSAEPAVHPPAAAAPSASSGTPGAIGDTAFLALAAAFGSHRDARRSAPLSVAEVEAALAKEGLTRAALTADKLATALGHLAAGVASMSEEGELNAHGLPEAIRTVRPNIRRAPIGELRNYLAGVRDADRLHDYIDDYFESYRELSRRLPELTRKIKTLADRLSPKDFEKSPPKSWGGGVAYDKLWEQYRERYQGYERQGFGTSEESTRAWLLKLWLG
jgi:hypothetical protein